MTSKTMTTKELQTRVDDLEGKLTELTEKLLIIERNSVTNKEDKSKVRLNKDGTPRKKRSQCGYMVFSNQNRSQVRKDLLAELGEDKIPPGVVVKKLAELWNALGDDEKEPYNNQAKEMSNSSSSNTSDAE
tara:strand:- start:437 stop:829 length:393 start_codon:yes stop_codon:yes gene_type:complete